MSLIPLDEPRGDGPDADGNGPENTSLVGRFRSGLRTVLLALPGISAVSETDRPGDRIEAVTDTTELGGSTDGKASAALPSGKTNGVEVVSTETGDTLTVEAVGNPDATISSDTWEPVER